MQQMQEREREKEEGKDRRITCAREGQDTTKIRKEREKESRGILRGTERLSDDDACNKADEGERYVSSGCSSSSSSSRRGERSAGRERGSGGCREHQFNQANDSLITCDCGPLTGTGTGTGVCLAE